MSLSQIQQSEDVYDSMTVLVGSAIRLLHGESGVFVVSNEAFDLQSSKEYTPYRLSDGALSSLLKLAERSMQPAWSHPLVIEPIPPEIAMEMGIDEEYVYGVERCSLFLHDTAGSLGMLHLIRPAHAYSCFDNAEGTNGALPLFIAQIASGLRFALRSQSLVKEQGRLAAIFHYSTEGILTVDNALRITDFNPAMERCVQKIARVTILA